MEVAHAPADRRFFLLNAVVSVAALALLAWLLVFRGASDRSVGSLHRLPAVNATLNAVAAVLLSAGYVAIRRGSRRAHRNLMISAFIASSLFLVSYLVYHYLHGDTHYRGLGPMRGVYFTVLASHIVLSVPVIPLALSAFYFAYRRRFAAHRRVTRWLLPIWLYVSVTGVLVFALLRASGSA